MQDIANLEFTLHSATIKTKREILISLFIKHLHYTLLLLKRLRRKEKKFREEYLHYTLLLLKH